MKRLLAITAAGVLGVVLSAAGPLVPEARSADPPSRHGDRQRDWYGDHHDYRWGRGDRDRDWYRGGDRYRDRDWWRDRGRWDRDRPRYREPWEYYRYRY